VLLEIWNTHMPAPARSLGEALSLDANAFSILNALIESGPTSGFAVDALRTRLTHFSREDARIPLAAEAFARADAGGVGRLTAESQHDADTMLGNQIPETRALVKLALDLRAFAASAFGAGFGGSVWALCPLGDADRFAARWLERYRAEFPNPTTAETFVARPGPPLTELTAE
jgi:galactokinase